MYSIKRSGTEIDGVINDCVEKIDRGGSRFPGMTFEEGIVEALRWVMGEQDDNPYPDG